jgi:hypothetical protein
MTKISPKLPSRMAQRLGHTHKAEVGSLRGTKYHSSPHPLHKNSQICAQWIAYKATINLINFKSISVHNGNLIKQFFIPINFGSSQIPGLA